MEDQREYLLNIIRSTGTEIETEQIVIIERGVPHKPAGLHPGKMGIYMFEYKGHYLKIGKAGPNSDARFRSQHYNSGGSNSNLAKSILADRDFSELSLSPANVGDWIKQNVRRIDLYIDASLGLFVLNLIEALLHCKFKPKYEGFDNQR